VSIVVSGADLVRALEAIGFEEVGQKGSHKKLRKGDRVVIIPMHAEIRVGTLQSILRQAGITKEQLRALL